MKQNIFQALGERSFLLLWLSEIFTQISINLLNFLLILEVFRLTHSNTAVSGVVISFTLPAIFLGIIAGVFVDHWSKKKVLLVVNILRALCLVILALFNTSLFAIYVLSLLIAIATQFFIPAETPLIPQIVKSNHLFSANALFGLGVYGSILAAYVLMGPLLIWFGTVNILLILALFLIVGALCISLIQNPSDRRSKQAPSLFIISQKGIMKEMRQAVTIVTKSKEISQSIFLLALSQTLIWIIAVVAPGYATEVLKMPIEDFPLTFIAPAALGVMAGAIILVYFFHDIPKQKIMTIGIFLSGIAMLILPYGKVIASKEIVQVINQYVDQVANITTMHMMMVIAFVLGLANAFVFVPSNTLIQEKTTDELRGKVYGVLNTLVGIFSLVPIILVGSLSDLIGVGKVLTGIGISLLIVGIGKVFFYKP